MRSENFALSASEWRHRRATYPISPFLNFLLEETNLYSRFADFSCRESQLRADRQRIQISSDFRAFPSGKPNFSWDLGTFRGDSRLIGEVAEFTSSLNLSK